MELLMKCRLIALLITFSQILSAGWTPLHQAIKRHDIEQVNTILDQPKPPVNERDTHGNTPAHIAMRYACDSAIYTLIKHGATVDTKNSAHETPAKIRRNQIKEIERQLGKQILTEDEIHRKHLFPKLHCNRTVVSKYDSDIFTPYPLTPLHEGAKNNDISLIRNTIQKGNVDINAQKYAYFSPTPLHLASRIGNLEAVKELTGFNASLNTSAIIDQEPQDDPIYLSKSPFLLGTPLHTAAYYGHNKIVQYYIDTQKISPDQPTKNGFSALYFATKQGYLPVVKTLLQKGANADGTNPGLPPTFVATRCARHSIFEELIKYATPERTFNFEAYNPEYINFNK